MRTPQEAEDFLGHLVWLARGRYSLGFALVIRGHDTAHFGTVPLVELLPERLGLVDALADMLEDAEDVLRVAEMRSLRQVWRTRIVPVAVFVQQRADIDVADDLCLVFQLVRDYEA